MWKTYVYKSLYMKKPKNVATAAMIVTRFQPSGLKWRDITSHTTVGSPSIRLLWISSRNGFWINEQKTQIGWEDLWKPTGWWLFEHFGCLFFMGGWFLTFPCETRCQPAECTCSFQYFFRGGLRPHRFLAPSPGTASLGHNSMFLVQLFIKLTSETWNEIWWLVSPEVHAVWWFSHCLNMFTHGFGIVGAAFGIGLLIDSPVYLQIFHVLAEDLGFPQNDTRKAFKFHSFLGWGVLRNLVPQKRR